MQLGMENTDRFFTGEAGARSFLAFWAKHICMNGDHTQPLQHVLSTQAPALPKAFVVTQHG